MQQRLILISTTKVLFLCTSAVGRSVGESANTAAVVLTSDKEWNVCRRTKEAIGGRKIDLCWTAVSDFKISRIGNQDCTRVLDEGGDPVLSIFIMNSHN